MGSSDEKDADVRRKSFSYQCMTCANKVEAKEAPFECAKCGSNMSFAKIDEWRFF